MTFPDLDLSHFPLGTTSQLGCITKRSKAATVEGAELVVRIAQAEKIVSNPQQLLASHPQAYTSVNCTVLACPFK